MKPYILALTALLSANVMAQVDEKSSFQDKFSYSYGYVLAKTQQNIIKDVNLEVALQAFNDFARQVKPPFSEEEMRNILKQAVELENAKPLKEFEQIALENQQKGEQFLKQNKGVKTLKSGLQVQWLEGASKKTHQYQRVEIRYEGRLIDGTVFDSSIARDEKRSFIMSELIVGLQQGINLMSVGDKARFYIPADLAYGKIGSGVVPSSSVLIYDVELINAQ